jgi:protein-S-isoprenylcysteine O-methyltransferase Ste14
MHKVVARLVADVLTVAIALFAAAGTLRWWRAWVLLAVLFIVRLVGARLVFRANPALMLERAESPIRDGQAPHDRMLVLAVLATGFVGLPVLAGIDRFHWQLLSRPTSVLAALGLVLFAVGWAIKSLALRANAFAVTVVRIQHEREHVVVDDGIYGIVRHPFYAADPLIFIGLGLWLESYVAVLCAVIPLTIVVWRLRMEEQVLRRELPGYSEYTTRVRHRLIPGVW